MVYSGHMDTPVPQPNPRPVALQQPPVPKASHRVLKIGAIAIAVTAVLGAAAWFGLPLVRDMLSGYGADAPATAPVPPPDPVATRDQERYRHVNEIRIALTSYVNDSKSYPESLDTLVPKYLPNLPKDPSTGAEYAYVKDDTGYVLTFTLEAGIFSLSPGEHFLTAKGIDIRADKPFAAEAENPTVITTVPAEPAPENPVPDAPGEAGQEADADGDGLSDQREAFFGTDPTNHDTDMDGLSDSEETGTYGTDPKDSDTDDDGYADGAEVDGGYDPKGPGKLL